MSNKCIYAGIVTFNPDLKTLNDNISSIHDQVDRIVIVDNASDNINEISGAIEKFGSNIIFFRNNKNMGIAFALNQLMEYGFDNRYEYMLTLDQDSKCPLNYVNDLIPLFGVDNKVGIVAPVIKDVNVGIVGHSPNPFGYVNTCITSGSIVDIKAWNKIGGYDNELFIDSVDFDFCYRLRKAGYLILQTNKKYLIHEIGNAESVKILFWNINVTNHSPFRKYYIARNNIYYPLKNRMYIRFLRGIFRDLGLILIVLFYEENKKLKLKKILNGMVDAFSMRKDKNEN